MVNFRFVALTLLTLVIIAMGQSAKASVYICGDANSDGALNVGDAVYMINYVFKNGPAPPEGCCGDCEDGQTESCYTGHPSTQNVGECTDGIRTCVLGVWGECIGQILPQDEDCDDLDNDCNGVPDDGLIPMPCEMQEGVCAGALKSCQGGMWQTCGPAEYGSDYEAVETRCDGLDNDCDGAVDEGFSNLGEPCWVGEGECARQGFYVCDPTGMGVECSADAGQPSSEYCDGLDNDCDGQVDEDFSNLGDPCIVGTGECANVGYMVCDPTGMMTECSADPGPPSTEVCDGIDNDCDGTIDEGFNVGDPCTVGMGACTNYGTMVCNGSGSGTECNAVPGSASPEICDGIDNDCDGSIDEGFNVGDPCTVGTGVCTSYGTMVCNGSGSGTECNAVPGTPSPESCDGLDNDCDGTIDDGFNVGDPCMVGAGVCANYGTMVCDASGTWTECSASPGTPSVESCDGLDNDCDGTIDDGFNVGDPCSVGVGACLSYGTMVCKGDGTGTECNAVPGTPTTEICNDGIDNDCDGFTDAADSDCP